MAKKETPPQISFIAKVSKMGGRQIIGIPKLQQVAVARIAGRTLRVRLEVID